MSPALQPLVQNKRSDVRYPVDVEVEYRAVLTNEIVVTGVGRTINMSTGGILFQTAESLPINQGIELFLSWPTRSINRLELHVVGHTKRAQGNLTAVAIRRYEFRKLRS